MQTKKTSSGFITFLLPAAVFLGLSAGLAIWGCSSRHQYRCSARPFDNGTDIKVMTFNVRSGSADDGPNNWSQRRQLVFDTLCAYRGDIIGLQEPLNFQVKELKKAFPEYGIIGVGRDDGKKKGEYSCIMYRKDRFRPAEQGTFWFSNSPWIPGSIHWGNACTRICTWARLIDKQAGQGFYVYNLHLDHLSQVSREKSTELLARKISLRKNKEPFIVTGDFNAGEDNPAILCLQGKGNFDSPAKLADSYRIMHPAETGLGTYHGFTGKPDYAKIDYIFVGPDITVKEAQIVTTETNGRYPSDHFPVTATLSLQKD